MIKLELDDFEAASVREALILKMASVNRSRAKYPSGSALFKAHSDELVALQKLSNKFGG